MATIVFSVGGEGRGHATRAHALVDALRARHRCIVYAPGDSWQLLHRAFEGTEVEVHSIPCPRFAYPGGERLSYVATGVAASRYLVGLPALVAELAGALGDARADLAVADFEPALPRAARRAGVPFVSVSHQHLLCACDLSDLPGWLARRARAMGWFVSAYYRGQARTVVSSFHCPPLKRGYEDAVTTNVFLRPSVRAISPSDGEHLVAYLRRKPPERVLAELAAVGREVRVYGLGELPARGALSFHAIDERAFVEDLASARCLVCTAGNQLVGESFHLGKPVLALPEPGNFEQHVNAHLLARSGGGEWVDAERFDRRVVHAFLERDGRYREKLAGLRGDGTTRAAEVIEESLLHARTAA